MSFGDHGVKPVSEQPVPLGGRVLVGYRGLGAGVPQAGHQLLRRGADNPEWLTGFTRQLVKERWCACAQNINPIRSIYRWEGAIEDDAEIRVALHTRTALIPALIERIKKDHPYDVACILAFPIHDANAVT